MPNVQFFPFDTLEAQAAKPERWNPTPNYPDEDLTAKLASATLTSDPTAASHIAIPKARDESDPLKKIDLASALQYGTAQGYPPLHSWIRQFTRENLHPNVPYRGGPEVILTCGSTDGFSKTLDLFVNSWDPEVNDICDRPGLLCENFIYSNVLGQSLPRGVQVVTVKSDAGGMLATGPGGLEDVLSNWDDTKGKRPHLMYTVTYVTLVPISVKVAFDYPFVPDPLKTDWATTPRVSCSLLSDESSSMLSAASTM